MNSKIDTKRRAVFIAEKNLDKEPDNSAAAIAFSLYD
jgi:hypothetical protein